MAEMSELILEGVFCQVCGEYLGEGFGIPQTCGACEDEEEEEFEFLEKEV